MPAAEVDVSPDTVRRLLADQHPDVAGLPLEVLANGWDNLICRLGGDLAVRLPRRAMAAKLVAHEQRWLPLLATRLPLPVPAPVRVGHAALGYPWPWSIVPFLPGRVAAGTPPADPRQAAVSLGGFLGALHSPAPSDAPVNPFRGVPLAERHKVFMENVDAVGDGLDRAAVLGQWEVAVATPRWDGPPVWLHGDLHPANVLVHDGRVSGVIDFGDITSGDPAIDLAIAWMLLPAGHHGAFRDAYGAANAHGVDEHTWARVRGWALVLSMVFLAHSADNPQLLQVGRRTMTALLT
jgi:aminoglycoside phosphotransferase (APT) family kinase protein